MNEAVFMLTLLISLVYVEYTEWSPGGLIVPGYLMLSWFQPERIVLTLLSGFLVWGGLWLLSHVVVLYGRRHFTMAVFIGFLIRLAFTAFWPSVLLSVGGVLGMVVPALAGREFQRQGLVKTLASMGMVMLIARFALLILFPEGRWMP